MKGASLYRQAVRGLRTSAVRPGTAQAGPSRLWTGAAIAVTIGTLWTVYPSMKSYRAVLNDAAPAVDHRIAQDDKNGVKIDPDTQIAFPIRLPLSSSGPSLSLVGLGVRKVSFLRVKVYSAGFYLEEGLQGRLSDIPGWQGFVAARLLASATSKGSSNDSSQLEGEALMANLLNEDIACAVRIVPTRNTDFAHLRDGFTRAIQARQKIARSAKSLSEADEEQISQSTQALKALFPAQSVPKGKALTLLRTGQGDLVVEYEGKTLGTVKDNWVSKELMLAYFSDKDVISQKLKEDVAAGLESISRR